MRYVYVQNGQVIDGPRYLPVNWNNISNFHVLDEESLKSFGWLPHRFVSTIVDETVVVIPSTFVIEENEVVEYQQTRLKTSEELQEDVVQKWINIRGRRNIELSDSDWTQLPDSPLSGTPKQEEWKIYRQSLRDITNYQNPSDVVWPEKPGTTDTPINEPLIGAQQDPPYPGAITGSE